MAVTTWLSLVLVIIIIILDLIMSLVLVNNQVLNKTKIAVRI